MIIKNWRVVAVLGLTILIFPVLISFVAGKINVHNNDNLTLSGKIIKVDDGGYVMEMDLEEFIPCVLMAQMPIDSPLEAMKAQAVVIRTYILQKMNEEVKISTRELGLPFVSYPKLQDIWFRQYRIKFPESLEGILGNIMGVGASKIFQENIEYLYTIIQKTNMKVLKKDGELILPLYHGISNGMTRDGAEILGSDYSYMKSVTCDSDMQQENYIGTSYFTMEEIINKLEAKDIIVYKDNKELFTNTEMDLQEFLEMIDCSNKDQAGYVISVKIGDTMVAGEDFAKVLGLNSTAMDISEYENGIRITTKGAGHGFGMSLAYAKQLAKDGMQWKKILKTFYDATITDY